MATRRTCLLRPLQAAVRSDCIRTPRFYIRPGESEENLTLIYETASQWFYGRTRKGAPALVSLMVNGREVQVPEGSTLREAILAAGLQTPTLCFHPSLDTGANCRACVVELEGARVLAPACNRRVSAGMKVLTDSERVRRARRVVFALLLSETDCAAAPELNAYARHYAASEAHFQLDAGRRELPVIQDNPFFVRDYAKCILCQRCTDACGPSVQHTFAITVVGRGHKASIGAGSAGDQLPESPCVFCGNCVGVCPTGALMDVREHAARREGLWPEETLAWSPERGFYREESA